MNVKRMVLSLIGGFVVLVLLIVGLTAVLGRLRATANFRKIAEELWPFIAAQPSTPMGEAEAAWLADRVR